MKKGLLLSRLIICLLAVIAIVIICTVGPIKLEVKKVLNSLFPEHFMYQIYYEDNKIQYDYNKLNFQDNDIKEVQVRSDKKYLVNHSRGFALSFPKDVEFDFLTQDEYFTAKSEDYKIVISKEYSPYEHAKSYVDESLNRFLLNKNYMEQNRITLHKNSVEKIGDHWIQMVAISRTPAPNSEIDKNTYVYCYVYTGTQEFYRVLYKANKYDDELLNEVYKTLYSFKTDLEFKGVSKMYTDYKPIENKNWSKETANLYNQIKNGNDFKWGIYTPHEVTNADLSKIEALEQQVNYKFDGVLEYIYFGYDIPLEGMKLAHSQNKIVELTVQTSTVMNEHLDGYNPVFDIYDGMKDDLIMKLANQLKEYGHPVLFRLNNEMNSDWTSYSANATLNDPDIYVEVWKRIYDIFEKQGVDNAIWVFNPNDKSYPPSAYNSFLAYYPGNEYVHILGITGYNTGDYYKDVFDEKWRDFSTIYDEIYKDYMPYFSQFPWIITEFSSSSIGGDKVKWINDMFEALPNYPQIKMAFWFNSADYDFREEKESKISRPYFMDETKETAEAFKENLNK